MMRLSEDDQVELELSFELLNKRADDLFLIFGPLCSFFIFFAPPPKIGLVCFLFFLFFSRILNVLILSLKANFLVTMATTASNLRLLATYQSIENDNNELDLRQRMILSEKISESLKAFNNKKLEQNAVAQVSFRRRTTVWYFEYFLYILPAALGYFFS